MCGTHLLASPAVFEASRARHIPRVVVSCIISSRRQKSPPSTSVDPVTARPPLANGHWRPSHVPIVAPGIPVRGNGTSSDSVLLSQFATHAPSMDKVLLSLVPLAWLNKTGEEGERRGRVSSLCGFFRHTAPRVPWPERRLLFAFLLFPEDFPPRGSANGVRQRGGSPSGKG